MNITISGHHLDVTPAMQEYVRSKLERVIRHFDQVIGINVLLCTDNHREKDERQKVEITLRLKGKEIFVEHSDADLYASIDIVVDKLDRQVVRHKDRVQTHEHTTLKHQQVADLD